MLSIAFSRLLLGLCLAFPLASLLGESGLGDRAEGDRALFEAGGFLLLETLRLQATHLAAVLAGLGPLLLLSLLLTAYANAALLVALNTAGKLLTQPWLAAALRKLPALLLLAAGTLLAQTVSLGLSAIAAGALTEPLTQPQSHDAKSAALMVVGAVVAGGLGGFADVAKASLIRHGGGLSGALTVAFGCLMQRPLATCFGWLPFAAPWLVALVLAGWASSALDVSRPGEWRVLLVLLVHQITVVLSVALRAAWFARALRLSAAGARSA